MKASELISALQNMINQHGDLEVYADTPPNINENTTIEDLQAYQIKRVLFDNIVLDNSSPIIVVSWVIILSPPVL